MPITGKLSVLVVQLLPPSVVFQSPPPGDPIQIILGSKGSKAIAFTLPFPLFFPLDKIIGVSKGPKGCQFDEEEILEFIIFSFSFSHSKNKAEEGKISFSGILFSKKYKERA